MSTEPNLTFQPKIKPGPLKVSGNTATIDTIEGPITVEGTAEIYKSFSTPTQYLIDVDYGATADQKIYGDVTEVNYRGVAGVVLRRHGFDVSSGFAAMYSWQTPEQQKATWKDLWAWFVDNLYRADEEKYGDKLEAKFPDGYKTVSTTFVQMVIPKDEKMAQPSPPPPPPPPPVVKDETKVREVYIPPTQFTEAKYTAGREFVIKSTLENYVGNYIETSKKTFFSGTKPEDNGQELYDIRPSSRLETAMKFIGSKIKPTLSQILSKPHRPTPKPSELKKGSLQRYFVQEVKSNKIVEVDKDSFNAAKSQPGVRAGEVTWSIKYPLEDQVIKGYPVEGSESKNKNAIKSLEKHIPGISLIVKDYKQFVNTTPKYQETRFNDFIDKTPSDISLYNSRKANFDKKD